MHEPHLLQAQAHRDMLARLETLSPASRARWGKMDVAQMLAHLSANLEASLSAEPVRQQLAGRLFGWLAKRQILHQGLPKSTPTSPAFVVADVRQFSSERERLRRALERVHQAADFTRQPHPFFGRLGADEWARLHYVHLDHHFRQFGA